MRHPFDLEISDLETSEDNTVVQLTDEEAASVGGGKALVSQTLTAVGPSEAGEDGYTPSSSTEIPPIKRPRSSKYDCACDGLSQAECTALLGEDGTPGPRL